MGGAVSGAEGWGGEGGGTAAGTAGLASKRERRFETDGVNGTAGDLAGSRMEACASDARGESKSKDAGSPGFTGPELALNSAVSTTGAPGPPQHTTYIS